MPFIRKRNVSREHQTKGKCRCDACASLRLRRIANYHRKTVDPHQPENQEAAEETLQP